MQLAKIYLTNKSVFYPGMCPKKERHLSIKCCVESIKPMNINEIGCRTEIREKMKEKIAKDNPSELFFYPIYICCQPVGWFGLLLSIVSSKFKFDEREKTFKQDVK